MALTPGTRLGPYEIVAPLGAGGMGEVYRARDSTLGRDVAIKVLPDLFAHDPERLARFKREAQILASLNHPNIAAIYGFEESDGVQALVLELVEGPTLADRLAHGRIPLEEALLIARQITDALETAHEHSIIHRDLKPANIKLRPDGTVKVLDFGLAKALEPVAGVGPPATASSTVTSPAMTRIGMILGTAAYMSPEQATGRAADKRSDVWAFGCVLYEMLTGKPPFEGQDVSDTLAAILRGVPDWTVLPANTPAPIVKLLRRCLEKDRRERIPDIAVARFEIKEALGPHEGGVADARPASARWRRVVTAAIVALVAGPLLTAVGWWAGRQWTPASKLHPMRFAIVPPATQPLAITGFDRDLVISPDGTRVVYVGGAAGETQLMVRAVDQLDAVPLHGITGVRGPFISPDGGWIGFFTGPGGEIKKVSITGGPPLSLCRYAAAPRGASWGPDDTIVFATSDPTTGLLSVSAAGGEPTVLTTPDRTHGEQDHVFPSVLPGARAVLFTITAAEAVESARVAVLDLKTGRYKTLVRNGSQAEYVATGYLVYAVAGTLRAVRFDPVRLEVLSDPVPVVEHVVTLETGATEFSLSRQGPLVYVPGGGLTGVTRALAWVNRHGQEELLKAPARAYVYPRLSPDGTRLALDIRDQESDIWIWDLARQTLTRLTTDPALDAYPVWTPDGRRVIFASAREGILNLFWQSAHNTGVAERLTTSPNPQSPDSISPDGTRLIFGELIAKTGTDLQVLRMDFPSTGTGASQRQAEPLVHTTFNEENGELSPDGRWLAYQSNESGQYQVYVRPFPHVDSGHWQISTSGGTTPVWARNGRELFYRDGTNAVTAVPIVGPNFGAGSPTKLFDGRYFVATGRTYDVSPDGQRFLMIKDNTAGDQTSTPASMVVVLNWVEELKARVPTK